MFASYHQSTSSVDSMGGDHQYQQHQEPAPRTVYGTISEHVRKGDIKLFCNTLPGFLRIQFGQLNFRIVCSNSREADYALSRIVQEFPGGLTKCTFANKEPEYKVIEEVGKPSNVLWTSSLYWSEPEFYDYVSRLQGFEKLVFGVSHSWIYFRDVESARRVLDEFNMTTNLYTVFSKKGSGGSGGSGDLGASSSSSRDYDAQFLSWEGVEETLPRRQSDYSLSSNHSNNNSTFSNNRNQQLYHNVNTNNNNNQAANTTSNLQSPQAFLYRRRSTAVLPTSLPHNQQQQQQQQLLFQNQQASFLDTRRRTISAISHSPDTSPPPLPPTFQLHGNNQFNQHMQQQQQQQQQQVTPSTSPLGGGVGGLGNGTYFQTSQRTGSVSSTPAFPVGSRHTTPSPTHSFHSQYNSGYNRGGGSGIGGISAGGDVELELEELVRRRRENSFGNNGNPTIGSGAGVGSNSGAGGFRNNSDSVYSPGSVASGGGGGYQQLQFQQQQQQQSHSQQQQQQQQHQIGGVGSVYGNSGAVSPTSSRGSYGSSGAAALGARRSAGNFGSGGSAGGSGNGRDFSPGGDMLERLKIVERKLRFALVDEREGGGGETNGDDYGEESVGEVMASIECMVDVLLGVR